MRPGDISTGPRLSHGWARRGGWVWFDQTGLVERDPGGDNQPGICIWMRDLLQMGATGYVRNERTIKPSLSIDDLDILARSGQPRAIKRRYIVVWGSSFFFLVCALVSVVCGRKCVNNRRLPFDLGWRDLRHMREQGLFSLPS